MAGGAELLAGAAAPAAASVPLARSRLTEHATQPPLLALRRLESTPRGLTEDEAGERLLNQPDEPPGGWRRPGHWSGHLLRTAANPFVLVLAFLGLVSALVRDARAAVLIAVLAVLSCLLRFRQEYRSDRAAAALRSLVTTTATVLRRSGPHAVPVAREVPVDQVVPGDIVVLNPGDLVPADLRLLSSTDLRVNQAALTGESFPAGKHASLTRTGASGETAGDLFDLPELCFMGTTVTAGSGTALAVATGPDTYFGATNRDLPRRPGETAFDRGVRAVSLALIAFMLAIVPLTLVVTGLIRGEWPQALVYAVAVAVAITPEMLPLVVTMALVSGARALGQAQVIVKRLPAVHDLGAMDTLCIDKTGTITLDEITLGCHLDPLGRPDPDVLGMARSNAYWSIELTGQPVGDTIDEALLAAGPASGEEAHGVGVVPFDAVRRRATVAVTVGAGRHRLITKGAVEDVLAVCDRVRRTGRDVALDAAERRRLTALADAHAADGLRVLGVAVADRPATGRAYGPADERRMTLVGFVGFRDEPDPSAAALAGLAGHGVAVVVTTGDHPLAARRVCRDAGLPVRLVMTRDDLDVLSDTELASRLGGGRPGVVVVSRVDPQHKVRVVRALQAAGRTVGYLGDGVNDAPALRAADVGISVQNAVGLARESADVILAGKDLRAVERAVAQGRRTVGNTIKYLKISVSSNLGNVLSMLTAGALLPFLPMLPLQILIQNLFFDLSQLSLAYDRVDGPEVDRPRTFQVADLARFVACTGPIGSVFDVLTFGGFWWLLHAHGGAAGQALFHTGWFAENLLSQAVALCLLRSRGRRHGAPGPRRPVLAAAAAVSLGGLALPFSPLAGVLGFAPLPAAAFPLLAAVLAGYTAATLAARALYLRVFRCWL